MSVPREPLSFGQASALVEQHAALLVRCVRTTEELPLLEAQGRVVAAPVVADRDQPPFARSTRDGFAGRAEDWNRSALPEVPSGAPPVSIAVLGMLRAGEVWHGGVIQAGTCVEIMTGAPVPAGADCVVMVEHVGRVAAWSASRESQGEGVMLAQGRSIAAGDNIVPTGAEAAAGSSLLPAGTRLNAHGIAIAAACGAATVQVFRKPRVAILSTGDELVDVAEMPLPHQIRNSNSYTLAAQVRALGGEPLLTSPVPDEAAALGTAIAKAAESCDLLLLSGGVSMGKYDLVEPALEALGGTLHFTGARIQPGKPVVFGSLPRVENAMGVEDGHASSFSKASGLPDTGSFSDSGLPFFGLPGNPVSAIVCFTLFVAPLLAALGGQQGYAPPFVQARLRGHVKAKSGLTRFLPALLTHDVAGSSVEVIAWQGSGDLASTARANCFLVVPEDTADLGSGDMVTILPA